jgi:hypothetical protein
MFHVHKRASPLIGWLVIWLSFTSPIALADASYIRPVGKLSVQAARAVEAALPEFERLMSKAKADQNQGYQVSVFETRTELIVGFAMPLPLGSVGSYKGAPSIAVHIDRATLKLLSSNYAR